jgi:hypothetical protein
VTNRSSAVGAEPIKLLHAVPHSGEVIRKLDAAYAALIRIRSLPHDATIDEAKGIAEEAMKV